MTKKARKASRRANSFRGSLGGRGCFCRTKRDGSAHSPPFGIRRTYIVVHRYTRVLGLAVSRDLHIRVAHQSTTRSGCARRLAKQWRAWIPRRLIANTVTEDVTNHSHDSALGRTFAQRS
jgi:hypothetical protein